METAESQRDAPSLVGVLSFGAPNVASDVVFQFELCYFIGVFLQFALKSAVPGTMPHYNLRQRNPISDIGFFLSYNLFVFI